MDFFEPEKAASFFLSNKHKTLLSVNSPVQDKLNIVWEICDIVGDPRPTSEIEFGYTEYSVAKLLIRNLWNKLLLSHQKEIAIPEENKPSFRDLRDFDSTMEPRTTASILGPYGYYPNRSINFSSADYYCYHRIPILVTYRNIKSALDANNLYSEIGYLNELEVKAGAAILLSEGHGAFHFYFQPSGSIEFSTKATQGMSTSNRQLFIYELLTRLVQEETKTNSFGVPRPPIRPSDYVYSAYNQIEAAKLIFNNISEDDQLLLRVCFYLCKGIMLWSNRAFGEDAIANVLFALEGTLLLYQRKNGGSDSKINLEQLTELFNREFKNGEDLFEFIKEGYDKRIEIVHASPFGEPEWEPSLIAEDFYEYYHITIELLNWILIERKFNYINSI